MTDIAPSPDSHRSAEPARTEPNPRWIRGWVGDRIVVDSRDSLFVWEFRYYPQWYFPVGDVQAELRPNGQVEQTDNRGPATVYDLVVADRVIPGVARRYLDSPVAELADRVHIRWDAMDRWLEEEVEVIVHPRSPYVRVDVLESSRRITVRVDDTVVAQSDRPRILYETGLPPRYYLPAEDVRTEYLTPTESVTSCPYKGHARYWNVSLNTGSSDTVHHDLVWGYDSPLPEAAEVQGLMCFYNEKVDIKLDGEPLARPVTKFS